MTRWFGVFVHCHEYMLVSSGRDILLLANARLVSKDFRNYLVLKTRVNLLQFWFLSPAPVEVCGTIDADLTKN